MWENEKLNGLRADKYFSRWSWILQQIITVLFSLENKLINLKQDKERCREIVVYETKTAGE